MREQRKAGRIRLKRTHRRIPVLLEVPGRAVRGEIVRLARNGFYATCDLPLKRSERVAATIEPDGRALEVQAVVARGAEPSEPPGYFMLVSKPLKPYLELYEGLLTE